MKFDIIFKRTVGGELHEDAISFEAQNMEKAIEKMTELAIADQCH